MNLVYRDKILDLSKTQVMGILNVTPDSFSDGGKFSRQIQRCVDAGIKRQNIILDPGFGFGKTLNSCAE